MRRDFDAARLKGVKLFVATPMYDGKCHSEYTFSIAQLTAACVEFGIVLQLFFLSHEPIVEKARNEAAARFLASGFDYLFFVDADIGFDAKDVVQLVALQLLAEQERALDVLAAPYPLKQLSWDLVLRAAKAGIADGDPDLLARAASPVTLNPVETGSFTIDSPLEVTLAGTGFMLIRRETFERVRRLDPGRAYRTIARVGGARQTSSEIYPFFRTEVDESGTYFSEDYAFCRRVREAGMKIWLCPWMALSHTGSHRFTGRLAELAAIGAV